MKEKKKKARKRRERKGELKEIKKVEVEVKTWMKKKGKESKALREKMISGGKKEKGPSCKCNCTREIVQQKAGMGSQKSEMRIRAKRD